MKHALDDKPFSRARDRLERVHDCEYTFEGVANRNRAETHLVE